MIRTSSELLAVRTALALVVCAFGWADVSRADGTIEYRVDLMAARTQTVGIEMVVPGVEGPELELRLPAWRPGKYQILDFAGSVRSLEAFSASGETLQVDKTDKATWRVKTEGEQTVRVRYEVYANSLHDRTRHADDTHAYLSGSSVFVFAPERRLDPVRVSLEMPEHWRVASGLEPEGSDSRVLVAADYDVLVDSPIEAGVHRRIEFDEGGKPHEVVIWGRGEVDEQRVREEFSAIVREQLAIFGNLPYERYVFLIHSAPGARGGTEHLNSTIMQTSPSTFEDDEQWDRFLGLVSHEMFHTWNVKQLRPAGIVPYRYDRENYTTLLWVAEGTTSYYDDLTLVRSGLIDVDAYLGRLERAVEGYRSRPGRLVQSLEESSFDSWVKFNRPSADSANSTVSFYRKGALVNMLLDLDIRTSSSGRATLDTVMRDLYERFPRSGPGFRAEDFVDAAERAGGVAYGGFYDDYVGGTAELPLEAALLRAGLELRLDPGEEDEEGVDDGRAGEGEAYLGLDVRDENGLAAVSRVLSDGPAYDAGVIVGDLVVALNGLRVRSGDLERMLDRLEPGRDVELTLFRRDELRRVSLVLMERGAGSWTIERVDDPTAEQRAMFEAWLHQPWDEAGENVATDTDSK